MVTLRKAEIDDIKIVLTWNETIESFLKQWSNFTYPLIEEQYLERIGSENFYVFSIDDDGILVGTIQIFNKNSENKTARVGCYLINPQTRGNGIGTKALKLLTEYAFNRMNIDTLELGVFDYNIGAIKCYEKVGFTKTGQYQHPMGWMGYNMAMSKLVV